MTTEQGNTFLYTIITNHVSLQQVLTFSCYTKLSDLKAKVKLKRYFLLKYLVQKLLTVPWLHYYDNQ